MLPVEWRRAFNHLFLREKRRGFVVWSRRIWPPEASASSLTSASLLELPTLGEGTAPITTVFHAKSPQECPPLKKCVEVFHDTLRPPRAED